MYRLKTGARAGIRSGPERGNCPNCEGTGTATAFQATRTRVQTWQEDDSHGPRCAQRFIGAAECTCGKAAALADA